MKKIFSSAEVVPWHYFTSQTLNCNLYKDRVTGL